MINASKTFLFIFIIYSLVFLFAYNALGQIGENTIEGKVLDEFSGKPIENARVTLYSYEFDQMDATVGEFQEKEKIGSVITDENGHYEFRKIGQGQYQVVAEADDYRLKTENIEVMSTEMATVQQDLALLSETQEMTLEMKKARDKMASAIELLQKGKNKKARKQIEKAIEIWPEYAFAYNALGIEYKNDGKWNKAEENFKKAVEYDPTDAAYQENLGAVYLAQQQYETALPYFEKAVELNPDSAQHQYHLGETFYRLERYEESEEHFLKSYELAPEKSAYALQFLGNVYLKLHNYESALTMFQDFLEAVPDAENKEQVEGVIAKIKEALGISE